MTSLCWSREDPATRILWPCSIAKDKLSRFLLGFGESACDREVKMQLGELGWKRGIDLGRVRSWFVFVAALAQ